MNMYIRLICPKSNASALYYSRNLLAYNLYTLDSATYGMNQRMNLLHTSLQLPLHNNANKIVIFSNGCNYQNRSALLSNALLHLAIKYNIIIESKYLEKGHTQMNPCTPS
ncbi:hypothetical protein PR048_021877 [Dryococelus australis]|uniref:Uncharacterized protein n=1 Tax=Dryococelus australis TaxID=614101 RepID=A0ABQ9GZF7_9NEOP|nr:hypothetical protein PR048_021877 [Dryococelus australis]